MSRVLFASLLMASTADAACCVQRGRVVRQVVQQVIPVVHYGAAQYSSPASQSKPPPSSFSEKILTQLERLVAALAHLETRIDRIEHGDNGVVAVDDPPPEAIPATPHVVVANCAKCHTGETERS